MFDFGKFSGETRNDDVDDDDDERSGRKAIIPKRAQVLFQVNVLSDDTHTAFPSIVCRSTTIDQIN